MVNSEVREERLTKESSKEKSRDRSVITMKKGEEKIAIRRRRTQK